MHIRDKLYINGDWVRSTGTGMRDVINSATEEVMGRIPEGTRQDVDLAVQAAAGAFPAWSRKTLEERVACCKVIGGALAARGEEIAVLISEEMGTPLKLSGMVQVGLPVGTFMTMAESAGKVLFEEQLGNSLIVREPVGVVGCITPWNYPLHQICAKVAPALVAGCTVVLKPSTVAPLDAFVLAEIFHAAGVPAGVFNLVSGPGPVVGEAIASHPRVDMISVTGSTRVGKRIAELCVPGVKRVALELGGKSPNVILDDADFPKAVADGVGKCFFNSGQTCSALTRMLVPRPRLAEVEQIAEATAKKFLVGDPRDPKVRLGPLVSAKQRELVRNYIKKGVEEGAKLVTGGVEPPEGLNKGYFVRPTIFSEVRSGMTIAQEEIFGPVLAIIPYDDEEEAVRIANDTIYGLAGGVWSGDVERAKRVARRIRAGQIEINGGAFNLAAPFGGYKQSGIGRENGRFGIEEFTQVKAMQV